MDKEKFKKEALQTIDKLFAMIDELEEKKAKIEEKKGEAYDQLKEEYDEKMAELKLKKEDLMMKYRKLQDSADDEWDDVKMAFSAASESFKDGFSKLASIFKK